MSLLSMFGFESLSPAPTDGFWYSPVGRQTSAGVVVNEDVAMTYSAVWAATMLLSSSEGMLPLKIYRPLDGGGSEVDYDHPAHSLLCYEPNPEMAAMPYRTSRTAQQINRGNCFSEIERGRGGQPVNLWPIHASRIPRSNIKRENGKLVYYVNNDMGPKTRIEAADMLHVPSPISEDGIYGLGVVTQARLTIGAGIAEETHGASYFGHGGSPKLVIKGFKGKDKESKEDFRRQWNEVHGGPENNGKPAILPEGCDVTALNFSAEDSQFLESRTFNVQEIARWYGIPPHLIQELSKSTYSNITQQSLEFVKFSLMRWLVLWEQEINRKLLTKEERQAGYFSKHIVEALERGDITTRTAALKDQFFNGSLTLNQWCALEDRNPIGPVGDIHWVQQAMIPVELAAMGPQQATPPNNAPPAMPPADEETPAEDSQPGDSANEPALAAMATAEQLTTVQIGIDGKLSEFAARIETLSAEKEQLQSLVTTSQQQTAAAMAVGKQLANAHLRDVWSRTLSVEINAVKRVAEKPEKFVSRLNEFYGKHTATLERNLLEPVTVCLSVSGDPRPAAEVVKILASTHAAESLKQIDALLSCQGSELPAKVEECVNKWHEERISVSLEAA